MRILHVVESLAPRYGGPSVACPALCRELVRRGHEVAIYTTNVDGDRLLDVPLGQPIFEKGVEIRYFPGWIQPREYKLSLALWRALREKVKTFDVAHIYSVYGFPTAAATHFCRIHGRPYLLHPHGSLDPYLRRRHQFRKWLYTKLLLQRSFRYASAVLFNSSEEMRLAADWPGLNSPAANGRSAPKKFVAYVGVEDEWFEQANRAACERLMRKFPQLSERRLVVFFGRLNFKKGLDILARAFARVGSAREDVHLVLAGPDSEGYVHKVRGWLKEGGVLEKTTYTGPLAGEDRFALMHAAEVFVLPSYTENFGAAVAEAMACAVPVVISDQVNIWPEVAQAGAGLVVRCDPKETAQALLALLDNPARGKEMGQRGGRLVAEKMTWRKVGEQMVEVYQEMLKSAARVMQAS